MSDKAARLWLARNRPATLSATSDSNVAAIATSFTAPERGSSKVLDTVAPSAGNLHGGRAATSAMRFREVSGASVTQGKKRMQSLPPSEGSRCAITRNAGPLMAR
jgi:hypothetical protein